jgi:hypothetical protein
MSMLQQLIRGQTQLALRLKDSQDTRNDETARCVDVKRRLLNMPRTTGPARYSLGI